MNNFDFGFRGDLNPHRTTSKQTGQRYVKGIDISRLNDDQLKEAVKRGYLKDKMLSKQDISRLRNILNERQNEVMTKMTSSSAYYESIRETEVSKESSLAARNAQRWFSRHHQTENTYTGESSAYDRYSGLYHREEALSESNVSESSVSETHTSNLSEQQIRYFNEHKEILEVKEIAKDKPVPGQISEKASVITKDNILSDKVKVVSVTGSTVAKEKGSQFIKGKNVDKKAVYKSLAKKRTVKEMQVKFFKNRQSKGLAKLLKRGGVLTKKAALPVMLAGSGAAAMCGILFPLTTIPLLNPNSAITNSNLPIEYTPLKQGIDYTEDYLQAYEENIFNFNEGSERSSIGIPCPWILDDVMTSKEEEQMVHKSPTAYYGEAEFVNYDGIIGYDLRTYWGPKSFLYKTAVTCTCDKCKAENEHGKTYKVILKGTAGLRGNASSDGTLYGEGGEGWSGDVYEGYISEGSETYDNRTEEDCEYRLTHKYQGSMYSEYRTRDEYEPIEKIKTSRSYIQGTPKEDRTEGIGNAANSVVDNTKMARDTYYPTQLIDYTKTQMYHAFAVMAIGISHNADECRKFFKKYMKKTYDLECNYAVLTLKTYPQSDETNLVTEREYDNGHGERFSPILRGEKDIVTFNIELPCGTIKEEAKIDHSYKARGFLNIEYKYCSIQDLVRLEEEVIDWVEKTTNEWLHREDIHETREEMAEYGQEVLKDTDVYSITDEGSKRYKCWNKKNNEGVWIGWFTKEKHGIRSAYLDHSMNHYELTDEDWAYGYPDLIWPEGVTDNFEYTRAVQYRKKKLPELISSLTEIDAEILMALSGGEATLPPEFIYPEVDGSKILNMFAYLNQGQFANIIRGASGESVKKSGCLDCSIAMIAMFYTRQNIPIQNVSRFANAKGRLDAASALAQYGLRQGGNIYGNFANGVINEINSGRPTIVHIRGYWQSSDGTVLHSHKSGHFLVATGYDNTGIYVYDPGKRANHHISYSDWATAGDLYYRPVYSK